MAEIHAYRKIVELQLEIVRLSRQNAALEQKCKQVQAELLLRHKQEAASKRIRSAVMRCLAKPQPVSISGMSALIRPGNLAAALERIWQAILP